MKECRCCKNIKLEEEFYKKPSNLDGLYSYCKTCSRVKSRETHAKHRGKRKEKAKEYREKNRKYLREKSSEYYWNNREKQLEKRAKYRCANKDKISLREALKRINDKNRFELNRKKHLKWSENNREKLNEYQRCWYQKNKEKRRAHVLLNRAVKSGKLKRPDNCSECGKKCKPDGHHKDYTQPFDVIWMCRACHSRKSPRTIIYVPSIGYNNLCKENS